MLFFLVIVCLRSFCSYDSPRPSSSMKLSPSFRAPLAHSLSLSLSHPFFPTAPPPVLSHSSTPFSFFRFLFIHIVGVTRAIQRNLVSPRRLFPSVAARNCRSRDSLESRKNASVLPSILQHHLPRSGYNSAEHLPSGFHCSPFFRFAPSHLLTSKTIRPLTFSSSRLARIKFHTTSPRTHGGTSGTEGNNF